MVNHRYVPDRGDLVWVTLDPVKGHEQKGRRPALVVSPRLYNHKTSLALCCPITMHVKGYPFEVAVAVGDIRGVVLSDHVRTLDWRRRKATHIGIVEATVMAEVEEKLLRLIKHEI